jgi:hypothetical protein
MFAPRIHFILKFQISKQIHHQCLTDFLKLWIFTNFDKVFPVVALVFDFEFDFDEFTERVPNPH